MARTALVLYETVFESVIRGHHVYKDFWMPVVGEILIVRPDNTDSGVHMRLIGTLWEFSKTMMV